MEFWRLFLDAWRLVLEARLMILPVLETCRQVLDAWAPILVGQRLVLEAWTPILESRGLFLGAWRPQKWIYGGLRTDKLEKPNILKYIRKPHENRRFSRVWSPGWT